MMSPHDRSSPPTPQPSLSAPVSSVSGAAKAGPPVGKILLGCGCLSLLLAGAAVAAIVGGGYLYVQKTEVGQTGKEIFELAESLDSSSSGKRSQTLEESKKGKKGNKKGKGVADALDSGKLLSWAGEPLTAQDVAQHERFIKAWEGSSTVKEMRSSRAELETLGKTIQDDRSALDNLKMLNAGKNFAVSAGKSYEELDALAAEYGGGHDVMRRYFQIVAVASAARDIAGESDLKAIASDQTAGKMRAAHPEWTQKYGTWRKITGEYYAVLMTAQTDPRRMEKLAQDPDFQKSGEEFQELNKLMADQPGLLLLGKISPQSVTTWSGLSASQRERILSEYSSVPFVPILMFAPDQLTSFEVMSKQLIALEFAEITREAMERNTKKPPAGDN